MPLVQLQRLRADGVPAELVDVDVANHAEWIQLMNPMDRRAREEGGYTLTVAEGAPLYRRAAFPGAEDEQ